MNTRKNRPSSASTRDANANRARPVTASPSPTVDGITAKAPANTIDARASTATNAPRHPAACPISVPIGTPAADDTANPDSTIDIALPTLSGATTAGPITKAAAMNTPCSAPATARVTRNRS